MDTETIVIDESELSFYCRACLKRPEEIVDLDAIYDQEDQLTYNTCFTICTTIDLNKENNLPHSLCKLCGLELQMAYDFHKKVVNATRQLKELLRNSSYVVISDGENTQNESILEQKLNSVEEPVQQSPGDDENFAVDELEEHLDFEDFQSGESADEDIMIVYTDDDMADALVEELQSNESLMESAENAHKEITDSMQENIPLETHPSYNPSNNEIDLEFKKILRIRPHTGPKVACDICKKLFINRSKMLCHRQMHDVDRVRYPCPQPDCMRLYATKQACNVHYRQAHLDEGYKCPVCHKLFAIKQTLEVHMRYHYGDFPFACDMCDKKFAQKGHLTTHKQVKHNNLRYVCTEPGCEKVFRNSMSLRNHRFIHTEMPFRCAYCDKKYPQKAKLKAHISVKHKIQLSIKDLESMRQFQETSRTRHIFVRVDNESSADDDATSNECKDTRDKDEQLLSDDTSMKNNL